MKKPGFFIFFFLAAILLITAVSAFAFLDTQTTSQQENRALAKMPELTEQTWLSGAFSQGMENFLSDHVLERGKWIAAAQKMEVSIGRKTDIQMVTHTTDLGGNQQTGTKTDLPAGVQQTQQAAVENETQSEQKTQTPVQETEQDQIVLDDRILIVYQTDADTQDYYVKTTNKLFGLFPDYIRKYCLLAPMRIAFEEPEYAQYSDDQRADIRAVYERLDPLITCVDTYTALEAYQGELDDLYFRTDHHWTHYGAYLAAQAMWDQVGAQAEKIDAFTQKKGNDFSGYLAAQNPSFVADKHQDRLVYYLPGQGSLKEELHSMEDDGKEKTEQAAVTNEKRQGYYTFVGRTFTYVVIDGRKTDGSCLIYISDSYGNALASWLGEQYDTVIEIDPRYFNGGKAGLQDLAEQYGMTDFMIVDYCGVLASPYYISQMEHLLE